MNPHHTGFVFASIRSLVNKDYDAKLLTPLMEIWPERYLEYSPKDFFYLMLRDPLPPGDVGWTEDVGVTPSPAWLPSVWHAMVKTPASSGDAGVQVELTAFDTGRVLFRLRLANVTKQEGSKREYASSALGAEDVHRVIAAVGLGNPHESRAMDNLRASTQLPLGGLSADETHGLALLPEAEAPATGNRDDTVQLPIILDDGKIPDAAREARSMRLRGAACVTRSGHAVLAMATSNSDEATALALSRVGCTRAVSFDRGAHRPTFLHRAGAGSPPLARYDESVLYVISRPMAHRAYRWNGAAP